MTDVASVVVREPIAGAVSARPKTMQVGQLVCELAGTEPAAARYTAAKQIVLGWIQNHRRLGALLPATAQAMPEFAVEEGGLLLQAVRLELEGADIWAARFQHPDDDVPGRTWTVETNVALSGDKAIFGYRMSASSLPGVDSPIQFSKPGVLRNVTEQMGLRDAGRLLDGVALNVTGSPEVDALHRLVFHPERSLPVLVVSELPRRWFGETDQYLVDCDGVARRLRFAAHVVRLSFAMGYEWQDKVGDLWSVYGGAARVYWPNARLTEEDRGRHGLFFPDRIAQWPSPDGNEQGVGVFTRWLERRCWAYQLSPEYRERFASFLDVRSRSIELAIQRAAKAGNLADEVVALRQQVEALRDEKQMATDIGNEYGKERDELKARVEDLEGQIFGLKQTISSLRRAKTAGTSAEAPDIPDTFDDLEAWCDKYLSGCVHVLPRAINAAKRSNYSEPALVYKALMLLANEYRNMRITGTTEAKEAFERQREALGIKPISRSGGETTFTKFSSDYEVSWGNKGEKRTLEWHLEKGGGRDERYFLRMYFFWDDESEQVVVGWMPGHLPNSLT
ncbi:MAG TPA: hypothetical protein PKL28_15630 [Rhodocyclaceae bacterium]|jgi:cell division protein FtsB|nr:hypothetical protein [Rhodocyclaceae bacterium]HMW76832.1 hypothetical protein [Rhodocyclaceae bacterium]HNE43801.1 hypothetical protein [Rhodocyclaceae bacterium]HNM23308.1 hypothetical protein [Rhodocyclaceae bacterium]HNM82487.1 hypothetical protein [Rhodocyclaceae bacterium]